MLVPVNRTLYKINCDPNNCSINWIAAKFLFEFEAVLKQIAKKVFVALKSGVRSIDSAPVSLTPTELHNVDLSQISPYFKLSKDSFCNKSVVRISRTQRTIKIEFHKAFLSPKRFEILFARLLMVLQAYSPGVSKILDHSDKTAGRACFYLNLADTGSKDIRSISPDGNYYAFSRQDRHLDVGLIPDPYSLSDLANERAFVPYDDKNLARSAYQKRSSLVFWRGSTTGGPDSVDIHLNQRIRFCIDALKYKESIDAKITNVVQFLSNKTAFKALTAAGVMGPMVTEAEFAKYKATMDLKGNSSAWGTLRKHLNLIHVIKPASKDVLFYNIGQAAETFTGVESIDEFFQKLRLDPSLIDNFETAWRGYLYALEVRKKMAAGDATVFPV